MNQELLSLFLQGCFPQLSCPECEKTFLTNVYGFECTGVPPALAQSCQQCQQALCNEVPDSTGFVLLEKRSLGLEYFCNAINEHQLVNVPYVRRIGILSEADEILPPTIVKLFTDEEPDYRLLYVMEKLEHLDETDRTFFTDHIYGFDWTKDEKRQELLQWMSEKYGETLTNDVRKLCRYFRKHEAYLGWDLHGDNLMRRPGTGELLILDPFAVKV